MSDKISLIVRFKLQQAAKAEFADRLKEVFAHIEREVTFIESSLQQDLDDQTPFWFTRCGMKLWSRS